MQKIKFEAKKLKEPVKDRSGKKTVYMVGFEDGTKLLVKASVAPGGEVYVRLTRPDGLASDARSKHGDKCFYENKSTMEGRDAVYLWSANLPCRLTSDGTLLPKRGFMEALKEIAEEEQ